MALCCMYPYQRTADYKMKATKLMIYEKQSGLIHVAEPHPLDTAAITRNVPIPTVVGVMSLFATLERQRNAKHSIIK